MRRAAQVMREAGDVADEVQRCVAPGGVRRAVTGFLLGAAAGALVALVLPRDEGPRRSVLPDHRPTPYD